MVVLSARETPDWRGDPVSLWSGRAVRQTLHKLPTGCASLSLIFSVWEMRPQRPPGGLFPEGGAL